MSKAKVEQVLEENEQTKNHIGDIMSANAKILFGLQ